MGKIIRINEITEKDKRELEDIDKKCLAMHVCPPPKTFINMKVHQGGELMLDYDMRSRSWVRNMYNFAACNMLFIGGNTGGSDTFGAGYMSAKSYGGTIYDNMYIYHAYGGRQSYSILGESGVTIIGIVVGTGDAAESFEGYALGTLITNGITSGKMSYTAMDAPTPSYNSGDKKWSVAYVRIINNNSGDSITVKECGICVHIDMSGYGNEYFMICRDVLVSPVAVADTAQLTVTYTMEMTFPA